MPRKAKTPAKASNSIRSERKGAAASTVVSSDSIASDRQRSARPVARSKSSAPPGR
ncbi:hypothetical protein NMB32_22865 [Stenotrophomonas sp. CD2]|nr:hypothetical protein NMB32_22865 [Stenotrophomonas sp. CD2]